MPNAANCSINVYWDICRGGTKDDWFIAAILSTRLSKTCMRLVLIISRHRRSDPCWPAREFAEIAQWLAWLGPHRTSHRHSGQSRGLCGAHMVEKSLSWAPYLLSDSKQVSSRPEDFFPSLRIRGHVALIGLCTARPSLPFLAVGSLGEKQLQLLAKLLEETWRCRADVGSF